MIRRREFFALTAGATLAAPLRALAQQAQLPPRGPGGRTWLIGALIGFTQAQSDAELVGPFAKELSDLGYVSGRDFRIEARYDDGDPTRDAALAREKVALGPDVVFTNSETRATAAP